ncbi:MAG TPA: LytTR family DNA-binding domain-containing protein [Clostridia bacterium]|nr:LytTR family DNA-binding domain-containing protein [Clostridia bacterium]HQO55699.1 LytTR family DNA-binding domain-containing protein [Clostridia bacterium]HUM60596.1 LytTR family DNA-binding domain-containing protein [Clostridia bacterium]
MGIRFRFIQDDTAEGLDITIRAKEKNAQVEALLKTLSEVSEKSACEQAFMEKHGIPLGSVILVMRDGRYVTAKMLDGDFIIRDALVRVEADLDPVWFVKISQSEIINLRYVKRWDFVGGGIIQIQAENGIVCHTSRRYAAHIRKILTKGRAKQ